MVEADENRMVACRVCGMKRGLLSGSLPVCLDCLRSSGEEVESSIRTAHQLSRTPFGLPVSVPRDSSGTVCTICANRCSIPEGQRGYCGLRTNQQGKLTGVSARRGKLSWYYDILPTNCVAGWVCSGGTGAGYPRFAHRAGPEYGFRNLAVFYAGCSFDCLFCQNWSFREEAWRQTGVAPQELASYANGSTSCICYFGGDPTPQLHHALSVSRLALRGSRSRILRICWETNGSMDARLLKKMMDLSWPSGGCIKFDLKAWSEDLHRALCGVGNRQTRENFAMAARRVSERPEPPPLIASTLLIPGYMDEAEIAEIAGFIASLDVTIPYTLLAFSPQFLMKDLSYTSRALADRCLTVARDAGLKRVRVGNEHLLC